MGLLGKIFGGSKKSKEPAPQMAPVNRNKIVCPYCFSEFAHHEVHFRVDKNSIQASVMSEDDIMDKYGDDENRMYEEMAKAKIARKFQRQVHDEKLSDFWMGRFKVKPEQRDDKEWNYPVITPEDTDMLFKGSAKEGHFFSNDDNQPFLYKLKDYYGNPATTRLCPHCHNVISPTYGKYPVVFISVVGITGSGKTVYLNQLIENLQNRLACAGLAVTAPFNMRSVDKIRKGRFLPMSTQEGIMYPPMMVNMAPVKSGTEQKRTLVFYDIAGENCTDQQKLESFGPYLAKSEAIILLVDPKQFITFNDNAGDNPATTVVNALVGFFGNQASKPLIATTLSKSDTLKKLTYDFTMEDIIRADSVLFKKIDWKPNVKGFYKSSYAQMAGEMVRLRKHIDPSGELDGPLQTEFKERAYFAISALGVEVQPQYNIGTSSDPFYIAISEETANKIEVLLQDNDEEPELYNGKRRVLLGVNPDTDEDVVWDFDTIKEAKEKVRYLMVSEPDPYRIEEPLLWILSRMNIIESVEA